jgi:quinol monooxygenase YgiN
VRESCQHFARTKPHAPLLDRGRHLSERASGLALHSAKVYHQGMNQLSRFVSLHPYFKVPSDKMPYLKAILPEFAAKTRNETGNLFYEFTINGDEVFCREGYVNAEALLAHLDNVSAMLAQTLTMAELLRIEVHGPAAELQKLKEPLAELNPAWFELDS